MTYLNIRLELKVKVIIFTGITMGVYIVFKLDLKPGVITVVLPSET